MDEYNPTPAQLSKDAGRVTFLLRIEGGEVIELAPVLQEIFRGELGKLWGAVFRETLRPESLS